MKRVLDLFCGCGGMSKGLEDAGLNIVAGLDIWDKAIDSYTQNFDHLSVCADISKLSPDLFDTKYKSYQLVRNIIQHLIWYALMGHKLLHPKFYLYVQVYLF